jgi:predicted O-methyltransferase YrrM
MELSSQTGNLKVYGDVYAVGGVTALSDIRKKDVVSRELPLSVEQIANAPTIKFTWKDKREVGEQVGTIAQYWQGVLPWVIKDKSGELSMQYGVAALISSITIARKVVNHEQRIKTLERENADLKQAYSFIKNAYDYLKMDYEQLKLKIA